MRGLWRPPTAAGNGAAGSNAAKRVYLNQEFGRSGNLDADINARGIEDAIRVNAYRSVTYTRAEGITNPSAFGTRVHQLFQRFNSRLANRVAGSYHVATEAFRDAIGLVQAPRSSGTIAVDVMYRPWGSPTGHFAPVIYDLKTYTTIPRRIAQARQNEFMFRFGARAQELLWQQW